MKMIILFVPFLAYGALTDTVHIDSSGSGLISEGYDWTSGVSVKLDTALSAYPSKPAGTVFFLLGGQTHYMSKGYVLSGNGTRTAPKKFIGVRAGTSHVGKQIIPSDYATDSASRPVFDLQSFRLTTTDSVQFEYINFLGDTVNAVTCGTEVTFENCGFISDYNSTNSRYFVAAGTDGAFIRCFFNIPFTNGLSAGAGTYVDDCTFFGNRSASGGTGVKVGAVSAQVTGSIFLNWSKAIDAGTYRNPKVTRNSFVSCSTSVYGTTLYNAIIRKNKAYKTLKYFIDITQADLNNIKLNSMDSLKYYKGVDTASFWKDINVKLLEEEKFDSTALRWNDSTATGFKDTLAEPPWIHD